MGFFDPDRYFASVADIDIQNDLLGLGFNHALLDIDNTIRSRATYAIPANVGLWLAEARDAGVTFCLLSNNWHGNAEELALKLDLPIVAKAMKPLPFGFLSAMKRIGATKQDAVCIGDQLMTDVIGAHLIGISAYMVMPLATVDLKHTQVLRNFERALMGSRQPEGAAINMIEEGKYPSD